jgi:hypothetical protein
VSVFSEQLAAIKSEADEVWRPIPQFEGYYVSSKGRVCSVGRGSPKILKTFGRNQVGLMRDGKQFIRALGGLQKEAFAKEAQNKEVTAREAVDYAMKMLMSALDGLEKVRRQL